MQRRGVFLILCTGDDPYGNVESESPRSMQNERMDEKFESAPQCRRKRFEMRKVGAEGFEPPSAGFLSRGATPRN